jgi:hypothetical protein
MNNLAEQGNTPAILALEQAMLASFDQEALKAQTDTQHYQIKGVYARTMFVPAGMLVTGKIHNFESIGILAQGTMRITNGETSVVVSAPYIAVDKPGIKRLGYAETDCTFISVHRTDAEEINDIEDELVSDTFEDYEIKRLGRPV